MKRLFDVFVSFSLLIILAPLFLVIALLIKLDSKGPVFFLQERYGQFKRPFRMFKFRSMRHESDKNGLLITPADDQRITKIGHWLRRLKLDELPQLINVVIGDMSLVGPRPEVARYVAMFPREFDEILSTKPGVTDLATLDYIDEAQLLRNIPDPEKYYIEEILPKKLLRSQEYIRTSSFITDLKIIGRTLHLILKSV